MTDTRTSGRSILVAVGIIILVLIVAAIARFLLKIALSAVLWILSIGIAIAVVSFLVARFRGRSDT